jgi:hypothetical protein
MSTSRSASGDGQGYAAEQVNRPDLGSVAVRPAARFDARSFDRLTEGE